MARQTSSQPTEVELQILAVLWERGPSTVRQVHEALAEQRDTGYSTTLKMMQVMLEKGLVRRNDSVRPPAQGKCAINASSRQWRRSWAKRPSPPRPEGGNGGRKLR